MAHIDPGTGEMVPCETTWSGPIEYAKTVKRLLDEGHISIEQIAKKCNRDVSEFRRALWLIELSKENQKRILCDMFIELLGEKVSTDKEWQGRLKAILKELVEL